MGEERLKTLLISDIHLGSDLNRSGDLLRVLGNAAFERLIILGDLFDHEKLYRLNSDDWRLIEFIRELSTETEREVIWIEGNHDEEVFKVMTHLLGVKGMERFEWTYEGTKFVAIHGHQFDRYHRSKSILSKAASRIFRNLMRLENRYGGHYFNRLSHGNKSWIRLAEEVGAAAMKYARAMKADYIFCGHTHKAGKVSSDDVVYINTGCWHDRVCHSVLVNNSDVILNSYT